MHGEAQQLANGLDFNRTAGNVLCCHDVAVSFVCFARVCERRDLQHNQMSQEGNRTQQLWSTTRRKVSNSNYGKSNRAQTNKATLKTTAQKNRDYATQTKTINNNYSSKQQHKQPTKHNIRTAMGI